MKGLLVIAHGSRNSDSNLETARLISALESKENRFDLITHAFLEIAQPDIAAGVAHLAEHGARTIAVLPYFLARGNHVARDVPGIIDQLSAAYPAIRFDLRPHIGASARMPDLVLSHLVDSGKAEF